MENIPKRLRIVALSFLVSCFILAQNTSAQETDWIALGDSMTQQGKLEEAKKAYKRALRADKDLLSAYAALGRVALKEGNWGDLKDNFGEILKREPDNFEAHYYRGIGYRESGKFKAFVLRRFDFNKARDHFQWIVQRDSLYRDVLYQWAVLKRFRDKYTDAIVLCHDQVRLKPHDAKTNTGLYALYRNFLRNKGEDDVISWLNQQTWPHARYFMGEVYRRKGDFDSAQPIFDELLAHPGDLNKQAIYLSQARIYFDEGDHVNGEKSFWRAVDEIRTRADAHLVFEDLKYIVNDDELERFYALDSISEYRLFFRSVWAKRDPTPAANLNVRIAEHYRRLNHVEKNYEFDGIKSWFNSPDKFEQLQFPEAYFANNEYNDKGLIYIRHGKPDDRVVTVGESVTTNESWLYYESSRTVRMAFHFLVDEYATGNNWRLTPVIYNAEMLSDRTHWGSVYHRMLNPNIGSRMGAELEMQNESIEAVQVGFSTDQHTFDEQVRPLDIPYYAASFRGPEGLSRLEVYYGFPLEQVARDLPENAREAKFERGFAISTSNWEPKDELVDTLQLAFSQDKLKETDLIIDIFQATMPADSYQVGFHLKPKLTNHLGGYNFPMRVPAYWKEGLGISDILLAFSIEPQETTGKFTRHGLKVVPNPSRAFLVDSPVSAYFEVYNLTMGQDGTTSFTVEYTVTLTKKKGKSIFKKLFGIFGGGGKSSISLSSTRGGTSEFSPEFVTFDVSKMKKGTYNLAVKIIDNNSGDSVEKEREVVLY